MQNAVVADDWHSHFSQWDVWKIAEKIIELDTDKLGSLA